ncbi:MAG: SDR family oxidoreductase [Dehalococcoidales bacterium]|nr:SDR family oxidoreductase [Dehalococcoidales bacterium]
MSRAVVTGGAGFIGSHLAGELVERGYRVTIIDDLSTGSLSNISSILDRSGVEFVRGSISSLSLLRRVFSGATYVFHQAAVVNAPASVKRPAHFHRTNATGTLNVLLAARDCGVKKVVIASSAAVYGDSPALVQTEDMPPDPLTPYAVTKLIGEYYAKVFRDNYGMATVSLRYFNVYGPRQNPKSVYGAVIPSFVSRVLSGKPPVIYGDGSQSRDFVFVRDVALANILFAESKATGVFNIGSGKKMTITGLAELIMKIIGKPDIRPVYRKARPGDILHSLADISKAMAFGYCPAFSLEDGLREFITWMKAGGHSL